MASDPKMIVRIAANLSELKKALAEGRDQIVTTTAGMQKMATSFQGDRLIQAAHNTAAAVNEIGGASKLTEREQARVNATVTQALQKYEALGREAPTALKQLAADTAKVETSSRSWSSVLAGAVAGGIAAITTKALEAGSALLRMAGQGLVDLIQRGGEVSTIADGFTRLAGGVDEADTMLATIRSSTKGLISDFDIMAGSNKAMLLGLGLNDQGMADLATTATVLGRAMKQDAGKSLDDLITALGRSSPLILDNLGLTVKVGEANEAYAAKLGKSASALTEAEKKQAFMTAAMEAARAKVAELGGVHLTFADHLGNVKRQFSNIYDAVARGIAQSPVLSAALGSIGESLSSAFGANQAGLVAGVTKAVNTLAMWIVDVARYAIEFGKTGAQVFGVLQMPVRALMVAVIGLAEGFAKTLEKISSLASSLPGVGPGMKLISDMAHTQATNFQEARVSAQDLLSSSWELATGQGAVRETLDKVSHALDDAKAKMEAARLSTAAYTEQTKQSTEAAGVNGKASETQAGSVTKAAESVRVAATYVADYVSLNPSYSAALREQTSLYQQQADVIHVGILPNLMSLQSMFVALHGTVSGGIGGGASVWSGLTDGLSETLDSIPDLLQQAFTGGGGIMGAVKALGVKIADAIVRPIQAAMSRIQTAAVGAGASAAAALGGATQGGLGSTVAGLASTIGGAAIATTGMGAALAGAGVAGTIALGAMTFGIGAAAVGVVYLARKWFGVSKEVKEARKDVADYQKELNNAATAQQQVEAGGEQWKLTVIQVRDAVTALGGSAEQAMQLVEAMWDTDNPERAKAAMEQVQAVMADFARTSEYTEGLMGQMFAAAEEAGHGIPAAMRESVDKLVELGLVSDETKAKLAGLGSDTDVDFRKMEETAKRFGIEVDSLGPRFQQQKINARAKDIIGSFELLTKGGADFGTVVFGMREEISALVDDSIKFGTTIPQNMRPMIEDLLRSGNLVDDNGDKLKDLSGIKFGDPIVDNLKIIADKMVELVDKLTGVKTKLGTELPAAGDIAEQRLSGAASGIAQKFDGVVQKIGGVRRAVNDIPRSVSIDFTGRVNMPDGVEIPALAEGGIVTRPTFALIGERGPEAVVPLSRGGAAHSLASQISVTIDARGALFNDHLSHEQLGRTVEDILVRRFEGRQQLQVAGI